MLFVPPSLQVAKRSSATIEASLRDAKKELKSIADQGSVRRANVVGASLDRLVLFLASQEGRLRPHVRVLESSNVVVEDQAAAADLNRQLKGSKRFAPPFIKTDKLPSWQQCAELHYLNELQTFALFLVTRVLLAERDGLIIAQLKMAISGQVCEGASDAIARF